MSSKELLGPTRLIQIRLPVALIEALGVMGRAKDVRRERADLITSSLKAMFWSWSHGRGGPDQIMAGVKGGYMDWDEKLRSQKEEVAELEKLYQLHDFPAAETDR